MITSNLLTDIWNRMQIIYFLLEKHIYLTESNSRKTFLFAYKNYVVETYITMLKICRNFVLCLFQYGLRGIS